MSEGLVYWIRMREHSDILSQGYVGVTNNLDRRIERHIYEAVNKKHVNYNLQKVLLTNDYIVDIVFFGEEQLCYTKEFELRPDYRIGWNIVPGGIGGSTTLGTKRSDEFKKKCSERMKGNKIAKGNNKPKSEEHRKKISDANKGKPVSEQRKQKQSMSMKGRTQTKESNEKRRLSLTGKKRGKYNKNKGDKHVDI